jgi:hypothetical protein
MAINRYKFKLKTFGKCIQEDMYSDMVLCGDVTQLAMLGDKCIGAIGCRLQMKEDGKAKLYILTLGVLTPYQNAGIGPVHSPSNIITKPDRGEHGSWKQFMHVHRISFFWNCLW